MRITPLVSTCMLLMSLTACASSPPQPASVVVGNERIQVLGASVKTVDELAKLLAEKKISRIALRTEPGTDYEKIGKVIYGATRNGVEIESVNGMTIK